MEGDLSFVLDEDLLQSDLEVALPAATATSEGVAAERIVEALSDDHGASFETALHILTDACAAAGAALGEWDGHGEPRVLASAGPLAEISDHLDICRFFIDAHRRRQSGPFCTAAFVADRIHYACAALARPGRDLLTLVVWANAAQSHDLSLLRLLLRLADPLRSPRVRRTPAAHKEPERSDDFPAGYIAGRSRTMQELHRRMRLVAPADFPLLVTGETGVGKEYVVRILHSWSRRRCGPFVPVNCAAIPDTLLEAEMFGIARGVASGVHERKGQFQLAEGGTLFLDEIGDLPLPLQAKLLRALQSHEVTPVGARSVDVNVRVIAATNADLEEKIRDGRFRADLYYRLAGAVLHVPPLRDHRDDIPQFIERFMRTFAAEAEHPIRGITVRALEMLTRAPWRGNVRELEHEIRRLVYTCAPGRAIDSTLLAEATLLGPQPALNESSPLDLATRVAEVERHTIRQALLRARGNRSVAARLLGLSRNGLALKMRRLGL